MYEHGRVVSLPVAVLFITNACRKPPLCMQIPSHIACMSHVASDATPATLRSMIFIAVMALEFPHVSQIQSLLQQWDGISPIPHRSSRSLNFNPELSIRLQRKHLPTRASMLSATIASIFISEDRVQLKRRYKHHRRKGFVNNFQSKRCCSGLRGYYGVLKASTSVMVGQLGLRKPLRSPLAGRKRTLG